MSKNAKKKSLTDWDWTTLVAAWRYYEHGHSITSYLFPHEIVKRFFTGDYDEESCRRIARQFVEIDHRIASTYSCCYLHPMSGLLTLDSEKEVRQVREIITNAVKRCGGSVDFHEQRIRFKLEV